MLGSSTAYAATGGNFILGKSNTAGGASMLTNKNGTALALNSAAGSAPLKVNRGVKVANLNADKLDGKDSSAFAYAAGKTGYVSSGGQSVDLDNDGVNDAIVALAQCPTGYQLTAGELGPGGALCERGPRPPSAPSLSATTRTGLSLGRQRPGWRREPPASNSSSSKWRARRGSSPPAVAPYALTRR